MPDRLEHFDDTFTEILIGLAIALLIAIGFAPKLVSVPAYQWLARLQYGDDKNNQYVIAMEDWPDPIVCPECKKLVQEPNVTNDEKPALATKKGKKNLPGTQDPPFELKQRESRQQAIFKENLFCMKDGWQVNKEYLSEQTGKWLTWPKNGKKVEANQKIKVVDLMYKEAGFFGWWKTQDTGIILLWLALGLFCVKLMHERSARRYLLQSSTVEIKGWSLFILWSSRIVLLSMLYLVIISVYINGYGRLGESNVLSSIVFAGLLISSFVVPDLFLYSCFVRSASNDANDQLFTNEVVWKWVALDIVNVVLAMILITGAFSPGIAVLVAISCLIVLGAWALLGHWRYDKGDRNVFSVIGAWIKNRDTKRKKITQIVVLVCIVLLVMLFSMAKEFNWYILTQDNLHNAAMLVLAVNLSDWIWNKGFFFGDA
jgi:hypothetical protein